MKSLFDHTVEITTDPSNEQHCDTCTDPIPAGETFLYNLAYFTPLPIPSEFIQCTQCEATFGPIMHEPY